MTESYDHEALIVMAPDVQVEFEKWLTARGLVLARIPDLDDEENDHLLYLPAYEVRRG